MPITFEMIEKGTEYSRQELAELWGYTSFHAIARGVVTPKADNKIVLFVTREKQSSAEQYADHFDGKILEWEGPTDHFAEGRIVKSRATDEEIHLFYRERHHSDFTYCGRLLVLSYTIYIERPSQFKFQAL